MDTNALTINHRWQTTPSTIRTMVSTRQHSNMAMSSHVFSTAKSIMCTKRLANNWSLSPTQYAMTEVSTKRSHTHIRLRNFHDTQFLSASSSSKIWFFYSKLYITDSAQPNWHNFCASLEVWQADLLRFQQDSLHSSQFYIRNTGKFT